MIKVLRTQAGLTQKDVSDALGFSTLQSISNIERGISPFPLKHTKAVAKLFNVSPNIVLKHHLRQYEKVARKRARLPNA